jgi:exopolyphosphatase/guanosine-5'-triphosphate,3'-diphosphate pyrophosphatase
MTARFIKSDPVEAKELKVLLAHYDAELSPVLDDVQKLKPVRVIGTSGAIENLVAMCAGGGSDAESSHVLKRSALEKLVNVLTESKAADRAAMKGLDDKRRDQILAAAVLVHELLRRLNMDQLELCESALREGMLVDYLAKHRPELEIRRQVANPRRRAIVDLGRRSHWNRAHAEQVAFLTLRLFDQLRNLHGLGREDRELIEYGALLHDIGWLIGREKHHKHSMYLILNGDLDPFSREEIGAIANIARYHRKAIPKRSHAQFRALPRRLRKTVKVGAALLRLADGLDRTNCSVVEDLACRVRPDGIEVLIDARGDAELELWSAASRAKLFERVFHRPVTFRQLA